jgi:hypothetical protein
MLEQKLLFPLEILPELLNERSAAWQRFLAEFLANGESLVPKTAMIVLLSRMIGCAGCEADSFRALRGCLPCAKQALKRNRENDTAIIALYRVTENEIKRYIKANKLEYGIL